MRWLAAAALMMAGVVGAFGQAPAAFISGKRPMTFADLATMKRMSDPQISSRGRQVLFIVTEASLDRNANTYSSWIVPVDGSAPEKAG